MRAIDADHLKRWILSRVFKTQLSVADILDQIDREDAVEPDLIYCKNCEYLDVQGTYGECGKGILGIVSRKAGRMR